MPLLSITLVNGEEDNEMKISNREATLFKAGLSKGHPFSFTDDEGTWVWFNPDVFAAVDIQKD